MRTDRNDQLDEALLDYLLDQERDWRKQTKRLSHKELLAAFPDALPTIRTKIKDWEAMRDEFSGTIKKKLTLIQKTTKDDFSQWFWREWVKQTDGRELITAEKHILRLKRFIWMAEKRKPSNGWIDEETKAQALSVPIETLLETEYRTSRRTACTLCPFHDEKTPSFYIYTDSNTFWCFGCGQGGDAIHFVRSLHNYSFKEAVEYLTR